MTPDETTLVRQSYDIAKTMSGQLAGRFYQRLFETSPEIAPLFGDTNMTSQAHKLMATLTLMVSSLKYPDVLLSASGELAERHVNYGVKPEHYAPVGDALIWALERSLGPEFDAETKAAWQSIYATISSAMIEAAYGTEIEAAE